MAQNLVKSDNVHISQIPTNVLESGKFIYDYGKFYDFSVYFI